MSKKTIAIWAGVVVAGMMVYPPWTKGGSRSYHWVFDTQSTYNMPSIDWPMLGFQTLMVAVIAGLVALISDDRKF